MSDIGLANNQVIASWRRPETRVQNLGTHAHYTCARSWIQQTEAPPYLIQSDNHMVLQNQVSEYVARYKTPTTALDPIIFWFSHELFAEI